MAIQIGSDGLLQLVVGRRLLKPQAQVVLQVLVELVTWKQQTEKKKQLNKQASTEEAGSSLRCLHAVILPKAYSASIQSEVAMLLAEFEQSLSAHNGARWSELALTPGSHLGPFNDLQIYHPCLRELASSSWGRCHGLLLASAHSGGVSLGLESMTTGNEKEMRYTSPSSLPSAGATADTTHHHTTGTRHHHQIG
ncbi:hypothetical protein FQN60_001848 [Etheostoma spectabile]|uniref:Uncharacterized protein n=1 Tax=Etheostoma spectabile TaxID=54343 RepID=A0A5J5DCZ1_9PERO|nr:hypothetical protein FQN60_001848 [Etheostoma spectabile]